MTDMYFYKISKILTSSYKSLDAKYTLLWK